MDLVSTWLTSLLLIFLSVCAPSSTDAWGKDGHRIICWIAQNRMEKHARQAVRHLLGKGWLENKCWWADEVGRIKYPRSAPLHYVRIPSNATDFDYDRDCKNGRCVVGAIIKNKRYLEDNYGRVPPCQDNDKLKESLLFLVHFMGDVHQPLHVGYKDDAGGKNILIDWLGDKQQVDLHSVWDTEMIKKALWDSRKTADALAREIAATIPPERIPNPQPSDFASESFTIARHHAYKDAYGRDVKNGSRLNLKYYDTRFKIVKERIGLAGARLARMLDDIFRPNVLTNSSSQIE